MTDTFRSDRHRPRNGDDPSSGSSGPALPSSRTIMRPPATACATPSQTSCAAAASRTSPEAVPASPPSGSRFARTRTSWPRTLPPPPGHNNPQSSTYRVSRHSFRLVIIRIYLFSLLKKNISRQVTIYGFMRGKNSNKIYRKIQRYQG